ncbi:interleukin-17 receptor B isoform X2 [Lemur catta]|uniref:interleukin-17 receptor B isoform X2 n=1 Tax=Lemur catta TaxID=9447 RepID=UPI001E26E1C7|nr:interleukin-17 receptor B isoform X2 [Lemur catta]
MHWPSREWEIQHILTPGDLRDLQVEPVKTSVTTEDYSILMNISWMLRADASIRLLNATKICVTGKGKFQSYSCVRCNYTKAFESQTRPSGGKWTFSYVGFPVEPNTRYFIGAHNIPNANMNEDGPSLSVNFTSPGCLDHTMKHKKKCIEAGSLWDPNITACKKNEKTVEVNFTASPLGNRYMALILNNTVIGFSNVLESNDLKVSLKSKARSLVVFDLLTRDSILDCLTYLHQNKLSRTSVVIPVTGESEGAVVQLIPYFSTCGNDCIRHKGTVVLCPQTGVPFPLDTNSSMLGGWLPFLLPSLLVVTWVLVAGIYLMWRHERIKTTSFSATTLLPTTKVLVVYPSEVCFHHTVCYFTEFLQNHCRSEVILEKWQKKKIAEMGPVQWLTTQKQAADKVIFLLSNDVNTACDSTCGKSEDSLSENSQDLFPLAFNLFCSDLRSHTHLRKYVVVYFREAGTKDDYSALSVCPQYHLMKDATTFCSELLHVKQHVSVGKRSQACHNGCFSL